MQCVSKSSTYCFAYYNQFIEIEGRSYGPQYRTIKTDLGNKNYLFPSLQFDKYMQYHHALSKIYFYTVTTIEDNVLKMLTLPNISSAMVCLGEATNNQFCSDNSLTLDEFIDLFWFTEFKFIDSDSPILPQKIELLPFLSKAPSVWMPEEYNLFYGWKRI